jgi:hypothetical protein
MKKNFLVSLAILIVFLVSGCENKESVPDDLQILISPDTLIINDQDTVRELFISTKPAWECDFLITQKPEWLTITPTQGIINGKKLQLTIRTKKAGLNAGRYSGDISIISDIAGTAEVKVTMAVAEQPQIKINPSSINFPDNVSEMDLTIQNTGNGPLTWSFANSPVWLSFSSSSGILAAGAYKIVKIACRRAGLDAITYTGGITINSNSFTTVLPIPVSMSVPVNTAIEVPVNLLFHELAEKQNVIVKNSGNAQVSWSAAAGNYLTLNRTSGTLAKGESQTIEVTVDRTSLQTGTYQSAITFSYGESKTASVPVQIKNLIQTKWGIEGTVKDAEFIRSVNRIIVVTTNPDRFSIIDPESRTIDMIALHSVPNCVSVNKTGDKAVVGHNGMITYIDITGKAIEKESLIGCDVLDVVLTSTGWVYAFPVRDQWTRIFCINPLNGESTQHTGNYIYAGTVGKLHPSEKWIYGANNGLSPSDIEKYNIENGTAVFSYDSPYHGDYPMNGNLWFSENGERIFTRGKTVLRTSADRASDMIYNGSLPCTNNIATLFHSAVNDKIFFIAYSNNNYERIPASEVLVCNYSYLTYLKSYPLEKFILPDNVTGVRYYNSEGHFVFVNSEGTKLYVIIKADKNSGLLSDWAIQNIAID